MQIDIITLFPEYFASPLSLSIVGRAVENKLVNFTIHHHREFGKGNRRQVDNTPYGGGAGMVMMVEPLLACYNSFPKLETSRTFFLSPRGKPFKQQMAQELAANYQQLIFIAGHYEGVDQRFLDITGAEELSLGDFVLTGGEPAIVAITDAIVRLIPGALGNEESAVNESFSVPLLEHDHYTMPRVFDGLKVPNVLMGGDHKKIDRWRLKNSFLRTAENRPELLATIPKDFFENNL